MMEKIELSDEIWKLEMPSLYGHYRRFDSAEAWDWYIRGCPPEWEWRPGLIDAVIVANKGLVGLKD